MKTVNQVGNQSSLYFFTIVDLETVTLLRLV